jgi:hypothetical protein
LQRTLACAPSQGKTSDQQAAATRGSASPLPLTACLLGWQVSIPRRPTLCYSLYGSKQRHEWW